MRMPKMIKRILFLMAITDLRQMFASLQNVLSNVCVGTGLVLLPQCIAVLEFDLVLK